MSKELVGVVLAGGRGTRLRPLTEQTSKQLLPVGQEPMILHVLRGLRNASIKDILLLIDHRHANQYLELLQDGSQLGFSSLGYVWQPSEGKGLPTAINQTRRFLQGRSMLVTCGDVLMDQGYGQIVREFREQNSGARLQSIELPDTAGYSRLKVVSDRVLDIQPKNQNRHIPGLIDLGTYLYHEDVFDRISTLSVSPRGETEINQLNQLYTQTGTLKHTQISGWWSDCGTLIDYGKAQIRYER